jgi:hypothetical protein
MRLTLADPAEPCLRGRRGRLVLAVTPGAAWAPLVVLDSAIRANHSKLRKRFPAQAALARRMRRRRSEDRSSSFRPPHVPYFSGRLTA